MSEVPADVIKAAIRAINDAGYGDVDYLDLYISEATRLISSAILAERERCAQFVEENTMISPHTGRWGFKKRKSPSMRARALAMGIRSGSE